MSTAQHTTSSAHSTAPASSAQPPRSSPRWVPQSLKAFDLTPLTSCASVPLPPVTPFHDPTTRTWEERDSYTQNATATPYHPKGWTGRLPGPGVAAQGAASTRGGK
ncbi:hypothetical protein OBBRIDRAFT_832828 [Obba rivulosa]|uniref:Uncharacterized protein n=1 Tax=Obba rivulosa TaxID=1052685 RepID=A0A8E2DNJ7_9APHY|nr:hypothetical protein OBBRIDRAFT_832828 [Obba rivulosa]